MLRTFPTISASLFVTRFTRSISLSFVVGTGILGIGSSLSAFFFDFENKPINIGITNSNAANNKKPPFMYAPFFNILMADNSITMRIITITTLMQPLISLSFIYPIFIFLFYLLFLFTETKVGINYFSKEIKVSNKNKIGHIFQYDLFFISM